MYISLYFINFIFRDILDDKIKCRFVCRKCSNFYEYKYYDEESISVNVNYHCLKCKTWCNIYNYFKWVKINNQCKYFLEKKSELDDKISNIFFESEKQKEEYINAYNFIKDMTDHILDCNHMSCHKALMESKKVIDKYEKEK